MGRVKTVSNPGTALLTTYNYDALGRVTSIIHPGGATTTTQHTGPHALVTDPAGNNHRRSEDGLGRTISVTEAHNVANYGFVTSYTYNGLDKLVGVAQGSQSRTYVYDTLGRLTSASNPEKLQPDAYTYDDNGNLLTRTDARGVVTNFSPSASPIDALDRVTRMTYTNLGTAPASPDVTYTYDSCTGGAGRLCSLSAGDTIRSFSYDTMGRVSNSRQRTGTTDYDFSYLYTPTGQLDRIIYPSGRVLQYGYDYADRVNSVTSGAVSASVNAYHPHGAPAQITMGNTVVENTTYNDRLQMSGLAAAKGGNTLLSLGYGYGAATANNGDVLSQTIGSGAATFSQTYLYDPLNRLKRIDESASGTASGTWWNQYNYDRYGNLFWENGSSTPSFAMARGPDHYDVTRNRLIKRYDGTALSGSTYDPEGNMANHPDVGAITYDAANRVTRVVSQGRTVDYVYDGEGRRVKRTYAGATTTYVYDAMGNLAAEYGSPGGSACDVCYLTVDALGSTRLLTDRNGVVKQRLDYHPFGEAILANSSFGNRQVVTDGQGSTTYNAVGGPAQQFTGKERDAEIGLDYFGARYLSSAQGRFTSPDPYIFQNAVGQHSSDAADRDQLLDRYVSNPQVWNKYAYGLNNPLKFIDPDGKCSRPTNQKEGETGICVEAFIAMDWFNGVGRGDNRTFSGTDKSLTARSRVKFTVDKDGKRSKPEVESERSGVLVKGMGLRGDTVAKVETKPNGDGSVSVHVSIWGRNGEAFLAPIAPSGVLQGSFNLNISKSGQVKFVPEGSSATTFPSWGVYGYGPGGNVQAVKEIPERKIEDLKKPPVPIR